MKIFRQPINRAPLPTHEEVIDQLLADDPDLVFFGRTDAYTIDTPEDFCRESHDARCSPEVSAHAYQRHKSMEAFGHHIHQRLMKERRLRQHEELYLQRRGSETDDAEIFVISGEAVATEAMAGAKEEAPDERADHRELHIFAPD